MCPSRVAVAMCTFNGGRFLQEQLESIASQTRLPEELVICDDGSTDDTVRLARAFAKKAPFPVRLICNEERMGPAKNFGRAIQLCEGDIICLADQDDIWKPQKVCKILEVFKKRADSVYAFSDAEMVDDIGARMDGTLWGTVGLQRQLAGFTGAGQVRTLLKHNLITGASMAFRGSFRDIVLPIPAGWIHDYWIALLGSVLSNGVPIPEPLLMYRRHTSQVCGWRKKTFWEVCKASWMTTGDASWAKVEHFRRLEERLQLIGSIEGAQERLNLLKEKELHLIARATARATRGLPKVAKVLTEAASGRYHRFSDSWHSIARDL